jgi:hypothetical protein
MKRYNLLTFKQIEVGCPWLQSNNAAGMSQMVELFPAELMLAFNLNDGDFHSVFSGQSVQTFEFGSQSYRKINKTYLYGSFNYSKSFEKGLNFTDTNDPAFNYPYLLTDTIGNDTYDREFFNLNGIISSPISSQMDWGLKFDYQVGVAAQNRDPRPENKVVHAHVSPGVLFKTDHLRLGANLLYGYYNEDIDVTVVAQNVSVSMFQLYGLGNFDYHNSNSFYRLYQQHEYGGGMQFEWRSGNVSNLLNSDYSCSVQTIDDGRKGGSATWAAAKNDSRLDGIDWNLIDVISVVKGEKVHQLKAMFRVANKLGTEFIQRLEKVNETDLEHWITYGKEQKYYSLQTNAGLNYQLISKDENNLMNSLVSGVVNYSVFDENYYLPDRNVSFSNMMIGASYLKLFVFPRSSFFAEMKLNYQFNLDRRQNLMEDNFMVQKIFRPEFNYLTKSYLSHGISLGYEVPVKKRSSKYFVKTEFDWVYSAGAFNRILFSFSTGIIF